MKIIGLTMITNPDYRQDVWRECIRQMLEICESVVVVVGREEDINLVGDWARSVGVIDRVEVDFVDWPQPAWCYSELPRHLNRGLELARSKGADWIIKFDADCFIHERDKEDVFKSLERDLQVGFLASDFVKLQFFKLDRAMVKTRVPIAIKGKSNVWYGKAKEGYNDLCQPIILSGTNPQTSEWERIPNAKHPVPVGSLIPRNLIGHTGQFVWNYSYSFKTEERARQLLYYFDVAHERFWGQSYGHRSFDQLSVDVSFNDFWNMVVVPSLAKSTRAFAPDDHPLWIIDRIKNIKSRELGHSLWGKIKS